MSSVTSIDVGSDLYLRTHLAADSRQLVDALALYVGKEMTVHAWDRGAIKVRRITLAAVGGNNVAFWYNGKRFVRDAFHVFGQQCTHIHNCNKVDLV